MDQEEVEEENEAKVEEGDGGVRETFRTPDLILPSSHPPPHRIPTSPLIPPLQHPAVQSDGLEGVRRRRERRAQQREGDANFHFRNWNSINGSQ